MNKLPREYYLHDDVITISKELLGKFLMTTIDGCTTGGMIVETEAYRAPEDKASHAYDLRRTPRNEAMYRQGGICYIYRCYGIHTLFNVVTNEKGTPHAILVRALEPLVGIDKMVERRRKKKLDRSIACGPGSLSQALGIDISLNMTALDSSVIWIEDRHVTVDADAVIASPRVGIEYAEEYALLPWRFRIKNNHWAGK